MVCEGTHGELQQLFPIGGRGEDTLKFPEDEICSELYFVTVILLFLYHTIDEK